MEDIFQILFLLSSHFVLPIFGDFFSSSRIYWYSAHSILRLFHSSFISCILTSTSVYNLEMIWISYHSCVLSIQTVQAVHKTGWFLGQISIKYLRIWMGSEMLVAEGWLWLKSIIKTGAKQMAKFWGFILLREDWAVTFDKWSITWTRQFWNEWEEYLLVVLVHTTTIACWLLCYKGQRHSTT